MADSVGRYRIAYNGEVYNFAEERNRLLQQGYTFNSHTDTEVILALYAEHGRHCVQYLRGMFAFAIWDSVRQELFLARRLGQATLLLSAKWTFFICLGNKMLISRPECTARRCRRCAIPLPDFFDHTGTTNLICWDLKITRWALGTFEPRWPAGHLRTGTLPVKRKTFHKSLFPIWSANCGSCYAKVLCYVR